MFTGLSLYFLFLLTVRTIKIHRMNCNTVNLHRISIRLANSVTTDTRQSKRYHDDYKDDLSCKALSTLSHLIH